jgi:cobaltochelatase CobN
MAKAGGHEVSVDAAEPLPRAGFYQPGIGPVGLERFTGSDKPVIPILFYRSMLLANDVAPIDDLTEALGARGLQAVPIFVASLRDESVLDTIRQAIARLKPAAMIAATAFASGAEPGTDSLFDELEVPVFQVVTATTRREAWVNGPRGLAPADLAMHVVLPELDGRILAGAVSFKDSGGAAQVNRAEPDRIAQVADRIAAFVRLKTKSAADRRITILMPDYPGAPGRTGYAVGLDVPASVIAMLRDLKDAGYAVENIPETSRDLMRLMEGRTQNLPLAAYTEWFDHLPDVPRTEVISAWGQPLEGKDFAFRAATFGNVTVALAPDRGRTAERRADYHDPALPPSHALLAFGLWMRETMKTDALVHVGAHGTLEWLPGKTAALSANCFPEIVTGSVPVIYPFIVSNPGEAAQAKRRIAAVTIGHLTPPLAVAGLNEEQQKLERLVDEYAQADGLDRRRRDRLAALIVETAKGTRLADEAGVDAGDDANTALQRIDAWLCDLKDFAIKDGLHIFGRGDEDADPNRAACAAAECDALLAALDGKHIRPGPAGAPSRGRTDVLPTGRNLFTSDPRTLPTPTAFALGQRAAGEVLRTYMQEHGGWPRSLVLDLWGSASLRTGGEEIAQGLALMGCRPQWDPATGRVTGIEVLPPAVLGRPRVDVTWRISGLFRDMFAAQIALLDVAVQAVAARDEADDENPLAAMTRAGGSRARIFGSAPGTYGAGPEELLASGGWTTRDELGQAYLEGASQSFGGVDGEGQAAGGDFAERLLDADLLVHTGDDPGRDILEGSADVSFIGGFAAAVKALGGKADLIVLDTTRPERPQARSLAQTLTRTVRARALNPRFIAGQMRHGPRGASEFAETVDRLIGFAETTDAVAEGLIGDVHDAYLGDETVRAFLLHQNPAAARFVAERFAAARRRGLWHPLRNSVDSDLAEMIAEATALEVAA